jgi:hypothetical protein
MQTGTLRSAALITAVALATGGCSSLTPGQNAAAFGGGAAILAGSIARAAGMSPAQSMLIGAGAGALVAVTAYVVAKHEATVRQRKIAEERARIAYARLAARQRAHDRAVAQARTTGSRPPANSVAKMPRYIAVATEKDEHTSPKAKQSVMIYDTESQGIVGNSVYDVSTPPSVGQTAKFDTYSAEYVGTGR